MLDDVTGDSNEVVVLVSVGEGADRSIIEAAALLGIPYTCVLPCRPTASKRISAAPARPGFRRFLTGAKQSRSARDRASDRISGYLWASHFIVDRAHTLIAVWDGQPANGRSGNGICDRRGGSALRASDLDSTEAPHGAHRPRAGDIHVRRSPHDRFANQSNDRFDVVGLRKQVEHRDAPDLPIAGDEHFEIASERCRITRHVDDPRQTFSPASSKGPRRVRTGHRPLSHRNRIDRCRRAETQRVTSSVTKRALPMPFRTALRRNCQLPSGSTSTPTTSRNCRASGSEKSPAPQNRSQTRPTLGTHQLQHMLDERGQQIIGRLEESSRVDQIIETADRDPKRVRRSAVERLETSARRPSPASQLESRRKFNVGRTNGCQSHVDFRTADDTTIDRHKVVRSPSEKPTAPVRRSVWSSTRARDPKA